LAVSRRVQDIKNMKTTWAIICSLVLAGTPFLLAQTPSSCIKQVRACCQHGGEMPCCKAKSTPDSQSKPAVPAQTGSQNQLSLLASSTLIWSLPSNPADSVSSHSTPSAMTASAPLYARDCALLI
jgi:hypothetical protein